MSKSIKSIKNDFLIVLDDNLIIVNIIPEKSKFYQYLNKSIYSILFENQQIQFLEFIRLIKDTNIVINFKIELKEERYYFNGYTNQSIIVILALSINMSEKEVLNEMVMLYSNQQNELYKQYKNTILHDNQAYDQISKLNSEVINSKRIIEKQNAELLKYNNLLQKMSIEDSLTGSYNRRYFYEYMRTHVLSTQNDESRCLIMIDFNHFKNINDQFGHDAGDRLLIKFVELTQTALNGVGDVYRLGGDEFILLSNHQCYDDAIQMIEKINKQFSEHARIASLAYGVVQFKSSDINNEFDLTNLIRKSDELMYIYKRSLSNKLI